MISTTETEGADPASVKAAIGKGAAALIAQMPKLGEANKALAALAAYKGGVKKDHPAIHAVIEDIEGRCADGKYKPGGEHYYLAGVEATLLADTDPIGHRKELEAIRDYLVAGQNDKGGWNYPSREKRISGDTSVTQYGCLGLWAIERAGIEVDNSVWENVLNWHVKYQSQDGGYAYLPGEPEGALKGKSELTMTINAVGSMHIAMINIDPEFLPLKQQKPNTQDENEPPPKFGVLEKIDLEKGAVAKTTSAVIPPASISSVRRGFGYLSARFRITNDETPHHKAYYYYSLERMASLANVENIGNAKWFDVCADHLIKNQQTDGSWRIGSVAPHNENDTAFAVLFLTRSTGKLLKRNVTPQLGDGLLAGGRGLPDDLASAEFNGRTVKAKEMPTEPLDKLLASLSNTGEVNIADVQEQIVEKVQLGDRDALVKQIDMLVKLVDHPDAEVRRTCAWALGRTNDMELAQHLINGLSDDDLGVMIESRNALCWLSRKPKGFGHPEDPLAELPPNATDREKKDAVSTWHKNAVMNWGEWYLRNRPFEDRGDAFEAKLRAKMEQLKFGLPPKS